MTTDPMEPTPDERLMAAKLKPKERIFIDEYLVDENPGRAAIAAGYSQKDADHTGRRLLKRPLVGDLVRSRLARRSADLRERTHVKLERLLLEALRAATVDPATAFDAAGKLLPIPEMPEDTRRALSGFDLVLRNVTTGDGAIDSVVKVRWVDKLKALELAGKLSGVYVERKEIGRPGAFKSLTDEQLREKAIEAARVLGLQVVDPDGRVM